MKYPFNVIVPTVVQPVIHPILFWQAVPIINPRDFCLAAKLFSEIVDQDQYHAKEFIKPGDVVIDAGANLGIFSALAHSLGAKVYAFEPRTQNCGILHKKKYLTVINKGLGDSVGTAEFFMTRDLGGASFDHIPNPIGSTMMEVTTIDAQNIPHVDFIKIDAEGSEARILQGARNTIQRDKPVIAMSAYHHPEDKDVLPKVLQSIDPGYVCELSTRAEEDFICYPKAA